MSMAVVPEPEVVAKDAPASLAPPPPQRELFGHPIGLSVLFATEMWERFCFYGMRALLALYVAHRLAQPDIAPSVPGFFAVRSAIEAVFGHLDNEQFADQIYDLQ